MQSNIVYIATSLDGYITDRNGGLEWLDSIPNPDRLDLGWTSFMSRVDAIIMGRNTFEAVCGFDVDWPYQKPVFVLSNSLTSLGDEFKDKVKLVKGDLSNVVKNLNQEGFSQLYIDGGLTVQNFLKEDLIDEMIITIMPILLGGGVSLFKKLPKELGFEHIKTEVFLDALVQSHYRRKR
ncbi:MAG: dihydrofolate reductase [Calditrichaeota bacterium]|nr:MAG: dihydrofolate reductase [Calditrichota bacterium]MBL1203883.1 dihydrofolate reductase [Calditrichota bacterium]NOG43715.1 dihydrofolate reductase [Calditrichota bacterium]